MNIKNEILNWFKTDRSFETGKQLFLKHGKSMSFKLTLNRAGNTPDNYKYLCYELAKIAGISEVQYKNILQVPLMKDISVETRGKVNELNDPQDILDQIETVDLTTLEWNKLRAVFKLSGLKTEGKANKVTIIEALQKEKQTRLVQSVPVEIRRSIKLREEFPFLKSKECPGILKELVADMLTAYENYVEGHQKMVESMDESVVNEISQTVVENYLENRMIWDELKYYKETKELLGQHPFFAWTKRREEIRNMNTPDLVKLKSQLENKIPRTKKLITDEPDHKETANRQERVTEFEHELTEVKQLLGLSDEK